MRSNQVSTTNAVAVAACAAAIGLILAPIASAAVPAFPGAEGPGAVATGGRGGDVYHVTNLNPDLPGTVPGSLSYGINNAPSAGRTIVFDVGGTIYLAGQTANDTIRYSKSKVTVAGQTAPGPGITIAGTGVKWTNTNLILRNITTRPNIGGASYDAFSLQLKNSIVDHVSATWFTDEGISQTDSGENSTVQYAVISEGLGGHAFGSLLSTEIDGTKASFSHNLYSHNVTRQPRIGSEKGDIGLVLNFTNNVIYDWYNGNAGSSGGSSQNSSTNFVGNYYIQGNNVGTNPFSGGSDTVGDTEIYQNDNRWDKNQNGVFDGAPGGTSMFSGEKTFVNTPFPVPGIDTVDPSDVALQRVLDYTGPNWQSRNPIEQRIINNVRNNAGSDLDNLSDSIHAPEWQTVLAQRTAVTRAANFDTDKDGMPDVWEAAHGLDPNSASGANGNNGDFDSDTYSNVEEYINELASWPAPKVLVFSNTDANSRFAQIGNWDNLWQPSRFDSAQVNSGNCIVDAVGQHAHSLTIANNSGSNATLQVTSGWIDITEKLSVGPGGTGAVTQFGGQVRAGTSVTLGGASSPATYNLTGGTLATPLLTKGNAASSFNFTGGTLHADTVNFSFTNNGGKIAPGSDPLLQQIAAASMKDITGNTEAEAVQSFVGTTHVVGDLTIQSGLLEIDLASLTSFDKINIDGALALGGSLSVVFDNGYVPTPGSQWLIGTAGGGISGAFSSVSPGFGTTVVGGNLFLTLVPEPGSLSLLAIGALPLQRRRRRLHN